MALSRALRQVSEHVTAPNRLLASGMGFRHQEHHSGVVIPYNSTITRGDCQPYGEAEKRNRTPGVAAPIRTPTTTCPGKGCGGLLRWDDVACANLCILCGRFDYHLTPGASVVKGPPSGHQGIDANRSKPIATRATFGTGLDTP